MALEAYHRHREKKFKSVKSQRRTTSLVHNTHILSLAQRNVNEKTCLFFKKLIFLDAFVSTEIVLEPTHQFRGIAQILFFSLCFCRYCVHYYLRSCKIIAYKNGRRRGRRQRNYIQYMSTGGSRSVSVRAAAVIFILFFFYNFVSPFTWAAQAWMCSVVLCGQRINLEENHNGCKWIAFNKIRNLLKNFRRMGERPNTPEIIYTRNSFWICWMRFIVERGCRNMYSCLSFFGCSCAHLKIAIPTMNTNLMKKYFVFFYTFDSFVGRTAHISMMICQVVATANRNRMKTKQNTTTTANKKPVVDLLDETQCEYIFYNEMYWSTLRTYAVSSSSSSFVECMATTTK